VSDIPLKFAHFPYLEKILQNETQSLSRPLVIADVACGPGELIRHCSIPAGCDLFGLDLWVYQLRQAAERNTYTGLCQANLVGGVPFKDNSIDVAYLGEILMYLPNTLEVLTDCFRLLRPGGMLIVYNPITLIPETAAKVKKWSRSVYQERGTISADRQSDWKSAKRAVRISYYSVRSLGEEIASAGFRVTNVKAFRLFRNRLRLLKRFERYDWYRNITETAVQRRPELASDILIEARKD
jgi:ubiquinone/menaquinone biosynthesis C-methylase UbiE